MYFNVKTSHMDYENDLSIIFDNFCVETPGSFSSWVFKSSPTWITFRYLCKSTELIIDLIPHHIKRQLLSICLACTTLQLLKCQLFITKGIWHIPKIHTHTKLYTNTLSINVAINLKMVWNPHLTYYYIANIAWIDIHTRRAPEVVFVYFYLILLFYLTDTIHYIDVCVYVLRLNIHWFVCCCCLQLEL